MATVYKTPGVYVEEISKLPASVAQVETALPAFIGYTEKAEELKTNDLLHVPTRISSLLEYEELFGGAPSMVVNEVVVDENNEFKSADMGSSYYMFDSIR